MEVKKDSLYFVYRTKRKKYKREELRKGLDNCERFNMTK
jgi:hypothetical protein